MNEKMRLRDLIEVSAEDVDAAVKERGSTGPDMPGFVASVAADKLNDVLDQDITSLLATGWSKVKEVQTAAARSRAAPGTTEVVMLGKHEQTSTHHPILSLSLGQQTLTELKFTLELVAAFKGVKLAVTDGHIQSVAPGEASALARLKFGNLKLKEKSTPKWNLPGEIRLEKAVPVPA